MMSHVIMSIISIYIIALIYVLYNNPPIKKEEYFPMLIDGFRNSNLRFLWKLLYLVIMYMAGLFFLFLWKSVEYPATLIKTVVIFTIFKKQKNKKDTK